MRVICDRCYLRLAFSRSQPSGIFFQWSNSSSTKTMGTPLEEEASPPVLLFRSSGLFSCNESNRPSLFQAMWLFKKSQIILQWSFIKCVIEKLQTNARFNQATGLVPSSCFLLHSIFSQFHQNFRLSKRILDLRRPWRLPIIWTCTDRKIYRLLTPTHMSINFHFRIH